MAFGEGVAGGNVPLEEGDGRRRMIGGCNQGGNFRPNMEKTGDVAWRRICNGFQQKSPGTVKVL